MTTYREIEESEVAIDAPITTSLITAIRDNPIAILEGDATSPTISKSAFVRTPSAGNFVVLETVTHQAVEDNNSAIQVKCLITGDYRFRLHIRNGMEDGDKFFQHEEEVEVILKTGGTTYMSHTVASGVAKKFTTDPATISAGTIVTMEVGPVNTDDGGVHDLDYNATVVFSIGISDSEGLYGGYFIEVGPQS